jgi:hypothetical protein
VSRTGTEVPESSSPFRERLEQQVRPQNLKERADVATAIEEGSRGPLGLVFAAPFVVGEAESTQRPRLIKRKNPAANFYPECLQNKAIQRARRSARDRER